jgi:hypothetical protein
MKCYLALIFADGQIVGQIKMSNQTGKCVSEQKKRKIFNRYNTECSNAVQIPVTYRYVTHIINTVPVVQVMSVLSIWKCQDPKLIALSASHGSNSVPGQECVIKNF